MSYYKETGVSRCEWCGKYIPTGSDFYTHNRNDSYATGIVFCCQEHMHLYDEKMGNKYSSRYQQEQEEEEQRSSHINAAEANTEWDIEHYFWPTTEIEYWECSKCKEWKDCWVNKYDAYPKLFRFQLNDRGFTCFSYLCSDCKYQLLAEERKFKEKKDRERQAEAEAEREKERMVEAWKARKRKRKRIKTILLALALIIGIPLLREAGIKISGALKGSGEKSAVSKAKQEAKAKEKKASKKSKKEAQEVQYVPGDLNISWKNKFKMTDVSANWNYKAQTVTFKFSELRNVSQEKTGSLRLALYLPEKEYTGGELGNKIAQLDIASQGLESGYGWKESTVTTDMSYIPPKGTYYPVIAILEYAKDAEGNGVWYVCSNNYVTFKPVNWNPGK